MPGDAETRELLDSPSPHAEVAGATYETLCSGLFYLSVFLLLLPFYLIVWLCCAGTFQLWGLQRPDNLIVKLLLPMLGALESNTGAGMSRNFFRAWQKWGDTFCTCNQVWMGSFRDVSKAFTSPQARTFNLGESALLPERLPDKKNTRCVFLLALSDQAAGGNGWHEAFLKCMVDYTLGAQDVATRRSDATANSLLDTLVQQYESMPHGPQEEFWTSQTGGWIPFVIKFLHYVMFGIDPSSEETFKILSAKYLGALDNLHYFNPVGWLYNNQREIEAVCAVYEQSPAFKEFRDNVLEHAGMTGREACSLLAAIMRIAGVTGTTAAGNIVMGGHGLPGYKSDFSQGLDQTKFWDTVDLDDEVEVRKYILECLRLDAPVSVTHRVATESFTTDIAGKSYTFPKGTRIGMNIGLANIDQKKWGETAYEFDMQRPGLLESYLSFNSVGGSHAGRECPGKDLVLGLLSELVRRLGKVRRRQRAGGGP